MFQSKPRINSFMMLGLPSGGSPSSGGGGSNLTLAISQAISGAGRVGFYFDYSELAGVGTHSFYVARNQGSSGAATVDYQSYGDSHTDTSGTLSWADGEMHIYRIDVPVPTKSANGEHRIYVDLSNATGAALHHDNYTRAYGVIDDDTIAADSDAVFFDSAAGGGGSGTQASPYNSIYTAISNVGSKRFIYCKGSVTPDGTNTGQPYGSSGNCITVPATRAGESARCIIRAWPGFTFTVDGNNNSDTNGFLAKSNQSYHTFRKIIFTQLSGDSTNRDAFGIWYHYGTSSAITVEHCTFSAIDGASGSNSGGVNLYNDGGGRVWRSTFGPVTLGGVVNHNTAGVFSFDGEKISVQRCTFNASGAHGIYHKRIASTEISITARFNIFNDCDLEMGNSSQGHNATLITNNLFIGASGKIVHDTDDNGVHGSNNQISNNYFYKSSSYSDAGAILVWAGYNDVLIFGNVFDQCAKAYVNYGNTIAYPRYIDYNVTYNVVGNDWRVDGTDYASSAAMYSATGFGQHNVEGNPSPTDGDNNDVTLGGGSAAIGANIGGTDAGVYLTSLEILGAD